MHACVHKSKYVCVYVCLRVVVMLCYTHYLQISTIHLVFDAGLQAARAIMWPRQRG